MNLHELKALPVAELRTLAGQHGLKPHHKAKPETIAKMIIEHVTTPPKQPDLKHKAERKVEPMVIHTQEQVMEVIAPYVEKKGLIVDFPGDDTVIFKCKGAEESLHLSSSLRNIKMKAESVSFGARKMHSLGRSIVDNMPVMAAG